VTDVQGTIARFTTAPKGEVDGAMLDNGTWIHWPPHLEASFSRLLKEGDRVRASGATETGPRGDTKFEVSRVTNLTTNAAAENEDFERGPRGRGRPAPPDRMRRPLPPDRGEITSVRGVVERMTTAPKGEVDGAVLENGTWLHWPPHLENQFTAILKVGDSVKAVGRTETGPAGDTHFEVSSVTNTRTDRTAENPDLPAAAPVEAGRQRGEPSGREQRLRDLERQVEDLQREIDRLRREDR
jgi:hypothetical protein